MINLGEGQSAFLKAMCGEEKETKQDKTKTNKQKKTCFAVSPPTMNPSVCSNPQSLISLLATGSVVPSYGSLLSTSLAFSNVVLMGETGLDSDSEGELLLISVDDELQSQ